MTQNSVAEGRGSGPASWRAPMLSLLLVVAALAVGEVAGRITGDDHLRWYLACFGVAFGIWTYAFFYDGVYRIAERWRRALTLIVLSAIGFGLVWALYPTSISLTKRLGMALILSVPAILELFKGRPLFRRTRP